MTADHPSWSSARPAASAGSSSRRRSGRATPRARWCATRQGRRLPATARGGRRRRHPARDFRPRWTASTPSCSPTAPTAGKVGAETVDYGGVRNVLAALGPRTARIALMTAIGVTNRTGAYNRSTEAHDWKRRSERLVRASGLPYTIVRPGWFDYNDPDQHRLVLLQGDTRRPATPATASSRGARSPRSWSHSLGSDAAIAQDLRTRRRARPGARRLRPAVRRSRCGPAGGAGRRPRHRQHAAGRRAAAGPRRPGSTRRVTNARSRPT